MVSLKIVWKNVFNTSLLSTYYVPDIILDRRDLVMNNTDKNPCPCGAIC